MFHGVQIHVIVLWWCIPWVQTEVEILFYQWLLSWWSLLGFFLQYAAIGQKQSFLMFWLRLKNDIFFEFLFYAGIFVALALRFDVSREKGERYFKSAFIGYAVGVIVTIIVMNWFQAAQVS